MTIRIIARIRPRQSHELDKDIIVSGASADDSSAAPPTLVKIPNPKNGSEDFTFAFSAVYGPEATQQEVFDNEVAPTVRHLFNGFDVTIFAYGVTGTGMLESFFKSVGDIMYISQGKGFFLGG